MALICLGNFEVEPSATTGLCYTREMRSSDFTVEEKGAGKYGIVAYVCHDYVVDTRTCPKLRI